MTGPITRRRKQGMKKLARICAKTFLVYIFCLSPSATAVVTGGSHALAVLSEPAVMIVLGTALISLANFGRRKVSRKK